MKHLFFLPFDHRSSFAKSLLGFPYPVETKTQAQQVKRMKNLVFEAFLAARKRSQHQEELALLVDEEFGTDILKKAQQLGVPVALTMEKSGQELFDFEHGKKFKQVLKQWKPTFAKALVRYNPKNTQGNKIQLARLKELSEVCMDLNLGFMFELLVEGEGTQIDLMETSMKQILKAGVKPTLWKLEGLNKQTEWKRLRALGSADMIMLGRGANKKTVDEWVRVGAKSGVPCGFAIGRTIFFKHLEALRDKKTTRAEAKERIAKTYLHYIKLWTNSER